MKQEAFRRELIRLTPDVPEVFHQRVEAFLEEKVNQEAQEAHEARMEASANRAITTGRRIGRRALVFALIALILLGTVAIAATHWGIFDALSAILGTQPPTADSVLQSMVHQETINGVEITIKEAGYDGRTLFLRYSYRLPDVDVPLGEKTDYGRYLHEEDMELLYDRGLGWWVDAFWINGQSMDMADDSGGVCEGTEVPGEILYTEYWRLDNLGVQLSGKVDIAMPIGESQSFEYRQALYDRETDKYALPDRGVVTFTLDTSDTIDRVVTLHPQAETVAPDVTIRVAEAAFTPLMTYITLEMEPNPDSLAAYKAEHGEGYLGEDGTLLWPYTGVEVYGDWITTMELVDGQGRMVFPDKYGCIGFSDTWAEFNYPYMDAENLPEELWLAPRGDDTADMTYAIRVK